MQRALDQIIHDVCLQNLPVTFAIDRGGVVGDDGPTHHGVFDLSFLRFIPNLILMAPKDERELQDMLYSAIMYPGPVAVRYPRGPGIGAELPGSFTKLPFGKGELLRAGSDVLILPVGNRVHPALAAAEGLQKLGIEAAVINPRFIAPLDADLIIEWAEKTGRVVTVEDNAKKGGFGSAVLELLAQRDRGRAVCSKILGIPNHFLEHGPQEILYKNAKIDTSAITQAVLDLLAASR
jgi:1-deoxy-D-xylulose-5-phosphate synthase